jgi:hypothetical protein
MRLWPLRTLNTRIVQPAKDATHEDQPHASILTKRVAAPLATPARPRRNCRQGALTPPRRRLTHETRYAGISGSRRFRRTCNARNPGLADC